MSTTSLDLSTILQVTVVVSPSGTPGPTFNQALLVGSSTVIPSSQRLRQYTSLAGMSGDGFSLTSPEYLAAEIYFAQSPAPTYLWIGRQDLTAMQGIAVGASGGSGYVVGDILGVVQGGASGGFVQVTTVSTGAVTGVQLIANSQGTGYAIANNLSTTGGTGTGAEINITSIGETPLQSLAACRAATSIWYAAMFVGPTEGGIVETTTGTASVNSTAITLASGTGVVIGQLITGAGIPANTFLASGSGTSWVLSQATTALLSSTTVNVYTPIGDADYKAMAGFIQAATPPSVFFLTNGSTNVLNNVSGNLFAYLQAQNYTRTFGIYSTTQSGQFPNNIYASAAPMGYAMGANTEAAGSYFDIMFKPMTSITTEPLTQTQVTTISGAPNRSSVGLSGNVFLSYANGAYAWIQNATMFSSSGSVFFDQILFLDMLASQIQIQGVNLLTSVPSLPLTNNGIAQMVNAISQACVQSQNIGFIAPAGTWLGVTVGPISSGTPLPKGYFVYSPPISSLTQGQRAARQLPPMNVLLIESQSAHSLVVTVNVQN